MNCSEVFLYYVNWKFLLLEVCPNLGMSNTSYLICSIEQGGVNSSLWMSDQESFNPRTESLEGRSKNKYQCN